MFALSTPNRLQILVCLRSGPRTVSEIVAAVGMEQSAVSHQLRVLREHSILSMRRIGRTRQYALRDDHVAALIDDALEHVRALERPANEVAGEPSHSGPSPPRPEPLSARAPTPASGRLALADRDHGR